MTLINPKGLAESFNLTVQYILHVLVYSSSHDPFFSFWPKLHVNTNLHIPKSSTFFDTHVKTYFLQLILICYLTIGSKARAPSQSYFKTIDDNRSSKKKSYSHTYNKKKKGVWIAGEGTFLNGCFTGYSEGLPNIRNQDTKRTMPY